MSPCGAPFSSITRLTPRTANIALAIYSGHPAQLAITRNTRVPDKPKNCVQHLNFYYTVSELNCLYSPIILLQHASVANHNEALLPLHVTIAKVDYSVVSN